MAINPDRYALDNLPLGKGGMGEVWGALDQRLGRRVALKFVRFPDGVPDPELEARFAHEATIMSRVSHPGMPAVYDFGRYRDPVQGSRLCLVMEFVEGTRLDDVIAEHGALPVGWVASIGAQVAAVLAAAHAAGVLHRDLKPANLMLCRDGSVRVVDFGLALMQDPKLTKLTRTGHVLGTAAYMSPEQVQAATATERSDLYALGCVLYELLTGESLFTGPNEFSVMDQHVNTLPTPVGVHRPEVPEELDELVLSLLAKRPEDRPGSAREVHERLMPYLSGTGPLGDMTSPEPSPARMYAHAVSRTLTGGPGGASAAGPAGRADAVAGRLGGFGGDEALDLRRRLAEALVAASDQRGAARQFQLLAAELADRYGPDDERVFQARLREITCHVHLGDTALARQLLRDLLADEIRVYSADDPRPLELRRRLGELEQAAGDVAAARRTLSALLDDLTRRYGPGHAAATRVREMLSGM